MLRMSVDDGCKLDLKVAELASRYELDCVFYIPAEWQTFMIRRGEEPLTLADVLYISSRFEIGSHGVTHDYLTRIPLEKALWELQESRDRLELMLNTKVNKFAFPRGYSNSDIDVYARKHYDFLRYTRGKTDDGFNLVHVHPESGANGHRIWQDLAREHKDVELWMHSWELEKFDLWRELEEFLHENSRR